MSDQQRRFREPKLVGGELCLDFANSLYWRAADEPFEWFTSYAELLRWCAAVGIITAQEAQALQRLAEKNPDEAKKVKEDAIGLREVIYRIFHALAANTQPDDGDVELLNLYVERFLNKQMIVKTSGGFGWGWREQPLSLDSVLWPVAQSAAELLTSEEAERVGQCPGDDCGWLYVDRSRRKNRRWCDMNDCGHRHNARESYRRSREE